MIKKSIQHFKCELANGDVVPIENICSITMYEDFSCFLKQNIEVFIKTMDNDWFKKTDESNSNEYEETFIENYGYDAYKEYKHMELFEKLTADEGDFNRFIRNFSYIYTFTKLHYKYLHRNSFIIVVIQFVNDESKLQHLVPLDSINNSAEEFETYLNHILESYFECAHEQTIENFKRGFKLQRCIT